MRPQRSALSLSAIGVVAVLAIGFLGILAASSPRGSAPANLGPVPSWSPSSARQTPAHTPHPHPAASHSRPAATRAQSSPTTIAPATSRTVATVAHASTTAIAVASSPPSTTYSTVAAGSTCTPLHPCPGSNPNTMSFYVRLVGGTIHCHYVAPPNLFGTVALGHGTWSCWVELRVAGQYTTRSASADHLSTAIQDVMYLMDEHGCPPVTGTITTGALGRRILLNIRLWGPKSHPPATVILDTGGIGIDLPNAMLQQAGFTPDGTATEIFPLVNRAPFPVTIYHIPYPRILSGGSWVPIGNGMVTVDGTPPGVPSLIGPVALKSGARLETRGSTWSMTPACGA